MIIVNKTKNQNILNRNPTSQKMSNQGVSTNNKIKLCTREISQGCFASFTHRQYSSGVILPAA